MNFAHGGNKWHMMTLLCWRSCQVEDKCFPIQNSLCSQHIRQKKSDVQKFCTAEFNVPQEVMARFIPLGKHMGT